MMEKRRPPVDPADPTIMGGEAWDELCLTLSDARRLVLGEGVPDSPRDRAEGFAYLTHLMSAGTVVCMEHADPDYPEFGRMIDHRMKWGLDAPDCLYLYATVRGDASYRISGNRGSANHIDIQVNHGHFASGDVSSWGTISSMNGLDLATGSDGSFELVLDSRRHDGNWLALEPGAEFVLVRQYFADWTRERPADLVIDRIGATYPAPPPRTDQVAARLARLGEWLRQGGRLWEQMSKGFLDLEPNSLIVHLPADSDERAGMAGQAYGIGNFQCERDEAVIVEITPPPCRHWSVSLASWYWESLDYATRQSSLNHTQARLDGDGRFRAVIAHEDPGVPNWLDAAGHTRGTIAARFLLAERAPTPVLRRVPLGTVRAELPDDTARVEPAERAATIAARRLGVLHRHRR